MTRLSEFLLRVKAKRQTTFLMRRYRVWYIDNPRAATVDRWFKAATHTVTYSGMDPITVPCTNGVARCPFHG